MLPKVSQCVSFDILLVTCTRVSIKSRSSLQIDW